MLKVWRTYRSAILVWIFCATAFVIGLTVLNPVYVNVCKTYKDGACQERQPVHLIIFTFDKVFEILSHAETWTALGTVAIATFTFTLWRSTKNLWVVTKTAAEHIPRVERAYVKISHKNRLEVSNEKVEIQVEVRNWGETPAQVRDVVLILVAAKTESDLPDLPQYSQSTEDAVSAFLVRGEHFNRTSKFDITKDRQEAIESRATTLFVIGYVDYADTFGGRYRAGYARRYVPNVEGNNLNFVTRTGYNYDRPRLPGEGNDWDV